jgi:acetoacetyl-CoA synthetase
VKKGDRVAGYLPNVPEATAALLATASMGAVWSSCSPDFGVQGVLDRFGQIEPKVLFCADGYSTAARSSIPGEGEPGARQAAERRGVRGHRLLGATGEGGHLAVRIPRAVPAAQIAFEPVEFNHPLYILYSSGTTGVPKCIVHGDRRHAAPALKEHRLQSDVRPAIACSTSRTSAG